MWDSESAIQEATPAQQQRCGTMPPNPADGLAPRPSRGRLARAQSRDARPNNNNNISPGADPYQEGVEAEDELAVAVKELQDAVDDARRVDALRLELLHDVEELRVCSTGEEKAPT